MATAEDGDSLARRHHTVVVLRLVLDGDGALSHGEVVDASGRARGRFGDWAALVTLLRSWLEGEAEKG
ncbi:hypothetical protein QRX60_34635 [Amycolatopsis mongoliensis]|uniref:Uncharacterized protein n=1 Tax=Amycolatopsis mongoliensis TaxID=715475 RepID=A0A9Y2NGZ4_9PSEU|nr:hypothetical protein [Amycolatopsis sp. 4-36]WIX99162.1 hypothetical protein QRX60_34635 [Amycolatopsis sp. 4-36]